MDDNIQPLRFSPLEADIRVVSPLNLPAGEDDEVNSEVSTSVPTHLFDKNLVDSLHVTTIPEPIRLR